MEGSLGQRWVRRLLQWTRWEMMLSELRKVEVVGRDRFKSCSISRIDIVPVACEGAREGSPNDAQFLASTTQWWSFYKLSSWRWEEWILEWRELVCTSHDYPIQTIPIRQVGCLAAPTLRLGVQQCSSLKLTLFFSYFLHSKSFSFILTYWYPPHLSRFISSFIFSARIPCVPSPLTWYHLGIL